MISFNSTRRNGRLSCPSSHVGSRSWRTRRARGTRCARHDRAAGRPSAAGLAEEVSWADWDFTYDRGDRGAQAQEVEAYERWIGRLLGTERPLDHQLAWFWHDHFAVSFQVVKSLPMMLEHLERCWALGRGNFRELIREITTDPAMLVFLDGNTSTGDAPNENYGRELLELYTVGINNFSEADVAAAAAALHRLGCSPIRRPRPVRGSAP